MTPMDAIEYEADQLGVSPNVLLGNRQDRAAVDARGRAILRAFQSGYSQTYIAKCLSKDRTTVHYALKRMGAL